MSLIPTSWPMSQIAVLRSMQYVIRIISELHQTLTAAKLLHLSQINGLGQNNSTIWVIHGIFKDFILNVYDRAKSQVFSRTASKLTEIKNFLFFETSPA
jgi:hypothetical protein